LSCTPAGVGSLELQNGLVLQQNLKLQLVLDGLELLQGLCGLVQQRGVIRLGLERGRCGLVLQWGRVVLAR